MPRRTNTRLEPIHLLYDERMLLHRPIDWEEPKVYPEYLDECADDYQVENPERLRVVYNRVCNLEQRLLDDDDIDININTDVVFKPVKCEMATREQICLAHSEEQYDRLDQLQYYTDTELKLISNQNGDNYYCHESFKAARLAAGGLLACVDAVCDSTDGSSMAKSGNNTTNKALALVRPPGHHACQSQEMGFCFIDSVVVAAKYALAHGKAKKVAILDWDIHDGNGTADATYSDENIFRIDIHRYNPKEGFYPYTGPPKDVGSGKARGLNLNMAWSHGGMGNTEYAAAFCELILPLLADYAPDLLLISCGLDAAMGDLLGGCELTPGFFHAMTRATLEVVGPDTPVVCALEGGYTMSVLPDCMESVTLAMLNCSYDYHSSLQLERYHCGGAAQEITPWSLDRLARSRRVLSRYYVREGCTMMISSALQDINTCIRIFKNLARWKHVRLTRINAPPSPSKKRNWSDAAAGVVGWPESPLSFQRPRIYLWYGTEKHHQNKIC